MSWKNIDGSIHDDSLDYLLTLFIFFIISAVIFRHGMLFLAIGLLSTYLLTTYFYQQTFLKQLFLKNNPTTIRLFPNETTSLSLHLKNQSLFPILNGKLSVKIGSAVKAYTFARDKGEYWEAFKVPVSVPHKSKVHVDIPLLAKKRGIAKVHFIHYTFPHLFNFKTNTLQYTKRYGTEIIVYPERLYVHGIQVLNRFQPGEGRHITSPFEDIHEPITTRDYQYNDSFKRINWKASAKSLSLQTNVYERMINRSFLFLINVETSQTTYVTIEHLLSYTAYLCEYATRQQIPYDIYINSFKLGNKPFIHFSSGEGKEHYRKTLEMLARVDAQPITYPFEQMVHHIKRYNDTYQTVIVIGHFPSQLKKKMIKSNVPVFQIVDIEEGAILSPVWTNQAMKRA